MARDRRRTADLAAARVDVSEVPWETGCPVRILPQRAGQADVTGGGASSLQEIPEAYEARTFHVASRYHPSPRARWDRSRKLRRGKRASARFEWGCQALSLHGRIVQNSAPNACPPWRQSDASGWVYRRRFLWSTALGSPGGFGGGAGVRLGASFARMLLSGLSAGSGGSGCPRSRHAEARPGPRAHRPSNRGVARRAHRLSFRAYQTNRDRRSSSRPSPCAHRASVA